MDDVRIQVSSSTHEFNNIEDLFDPEKVEFNEVKNGATITFLTDVTLGKPISITKKCTFDLGGHFFFIPMDAGVTVKNGVTVTFINGKIQSLSEGIVEDSLIVQGSKTTLVLGENLEVSTHGTAVHARRRGNLIIDGARVSSTGNQPTIYVDDAYSTLTMNNGHVASYEKSAIVVRDEGSLTINHGEVHTESNGLVPENTYPAVVIDGLNSKFELNDGTIFSNGTPAIKIQNAASAEMTGGEVYSKSENYPVIEVENNGSSFIMNNGWVYSTQTCAFVSNLMEYGDVHTIQMLDGAIGAVGEVFLVGGPGDHGILLSNGRVKGHVPQEYLPAGYVISDIPDEYGYCPIILKTWTNSEDASVVFPNADADPDVDNPFDIVYDKDEYSREPLFPNDVIDGSPARPVYPMDGPAPDVNIPDPGSCIPPDVPDFVPVPVPPGPFPPCPPKPPKPDTIVYNCSLNIKIPMYIYRTPSRSKVITEWKGALRVICGKYFSPEGEEFAMVKFRIPGSGDTVTGYAAVSDLKSHS